LTQKKNTQHLKTKYFNRSSKGTNPRWGKGRLRDQADLKNEQNTYEIKNKQVGKRACKKKIY